MRDVTVRIRNVRRVWTIVYAITQTTILHVGELVNVWVRTAQWRHTAIDADVTTRANVLVNDILVQTLKDVNLFVQALSQTKLATEREYYTATSVRQPSLVLLVTLCKYPWDVVDAWQNRKPLGE
jgi:post-segregation antitoxin (ccd killing protein)